MVDSGVPKGIILGPILFLLYINGLPEYVDCPVRLFAYMYDYVIYNQIDSPTDCKILQDLSKLEIWEDTLKMDFSPSKCFSMNITRKINPLVTDYSLKGTTLENTEHST